MREDYPRSKIYTNKNIKNAPVLYTDYYRELKYEDLEELYLNNDVFFIDVNNDYITKADYYKIYEDLKDVLINLPHWFEYRMISHKIHSDWVYIRYIFYVKMEEQHMRVQNYKIPYEIIDKIPLEYTDTNDRCDGGYDQDWQQIERVKNCILPEEIEKENEKFLKTIFKNTMLTS